MIKDLIKKILSVNPRDTDIINSLKNKFVHNQRSFNYGLTKRFVDCLYCHATPGTLEKTIEIVNNFPHKGKLLNLGGGTGQVAYIFSHLKYTVYNIDIDIKKEEENDKNINFNLNSNNKLPFSTESFDVVVCQEIIEHVENPWKLFRDVRSVLKNEGIFILSTPNIMSIQSRIKFLISGYFPWFTPDCFDYHINPISHWEIMNISSKSNFSLEGFYGSGDYFKKKMTPDRKKVFMSEGLIYCFKLKNDNN